MSKLVMDDRMDIGENIKLIKLMTDEEFEEFLKTLDKDEIDHDANSSKSEEMMK